MAKRERVVVLLRQHAVMCMREAEYFDLAYGTVTCAGSVDAIVAGRPPTFASRKFIKLGRQ